LRIREHEGKRVTTELQPLALEIIKESPELAAIGLMVFAWMAFTLKQKIWIRERDQEYGIKLNKGGCQFPEGHDCNGDKQTLQVHHVRPQRYMGLFGANPDYAENGISLCEHSHQGKVHPDMREARQGYGQDKNSYNKVFDQRAEKLKRGEIYWDDSWDRPMGTLAVRNTQRAERDGKTFPKGKNGKTK
jgi:hypothetical protein